ncbi:DUF2716 domain-containing protein [Streptomyces mirabilis]
MNLSHGNGSTGSTSQSAGPSARSLREPLWILDWQHICYRLRPDLPSTDMFLPRVLEGRSREGWPLSPYPDGDYYIFLADDLRFGTFGHPWEHSLCVFGAELLEAIAEDVSNAQDLWIGLGLDANGRTFPSDRLLISE